MSTITFETNGGSAIQSIQVNNGSLVTKPQNPTKANYTFINWYIDEALTVLWDFTADTVTQDVTLYAKWRVTIAAKLKEILLGIKADVADKIPLAQKGQAQGVATLDENSKIPIEQVNEVYNEVLEFATRQDFPTTGESAKLYIDRETKIIYLWSGATYDKSTSNQIFLQDEQPDNMLEGDIWLDID